MVLDPRFLGAGAFTDLLEQLAKDEQIGDGRFAPRNFLLECELPQPRIDAYLGHSNVPTANPDSGAALSHLNKFHNDYLAREVRSGSRANRFSDSDPSCPATFRAGCQIDEYGGADDNLLLVRLEAANDIANFSGVPTPALIALFEEVALANRNGSPLSHDQRSRSAGVLSSWQLQCDNRPLFAAFWEEAKGALQNLGDGWPDELRDRMGLVHYDPHYRGAPIPVVVFAYRVSLIPKGRADLRLLVRPSVLDGSLNPAFYTAPPKSGVGSTVDLGLRDDEPWQEIVHPSVRVEPKHIWAVGEITTPPSAPLRECRALHRQKLQVKYNADFGPLCDDIDGDLP